MIRRNILCSLILLCAFCIIAQGQINHKVSFNSFHISEVILDDGETYSKVNAGDLSGTDSIGYPLLPVLVSVKEEVLPTWGIQEMVV